MLKIGEEQVVDVTAKVMAMVIVMGVVAQVGAVEAEVVDVEAEYVVVDVETEVLDVEAVNAVVVDVEVKV